MQLNQIALSPSVPQAQAISLSPVLSYERGSLSHWRLWGWAGDAAGADSDSHILRSSNRSGSQTTPATESVARGRSGGTSSNVSPDNKVATAPTGLLLLTVVVAVVAFSKR